MKQSSSLVNNCNNFNSNNNSDCNNKKVNRIDTRINETDQSIQNVDTIPRQGIVGNLKKKKVDFLLNYDVKQVISASASKLAKHNDNKNNNDNGDVSTTKKYYSLVYTHNNYNNYSNSNSNSNSNNNNVKVIDAKIKETDQTTQKINDSTGPGIVSTPKKKKVAILSQIDSKKNIPAPVSQ